MSLTSLRFGIARWLYRGKKPNQLAAFLNGFWGLVASTGIVSSLMVTLEVIGRKSGRIVSLPVVIATVNGEHYLVSMLGDNVQWVQNVRAAQGKAFLKAGTRREIHLEEIPAAQRAPILKAYLQRAPGARPHSPLSKDAPVEEFEKIAADFPVFRIVETVTA